jgi:AbrB family looped-hinge helix DNA binding protein
MLVVIMKLAGIVKEIDSLGRIVIPKEIRNLFGLDSAVEIIVTDEGVLLRNPKYALTEIKGEK